MKKTILLTTLSLLLALPCGAQTTEIEKAFRRIEALEGFRPMTAEQLNEMNEEFKDQGGVAEGVLHNGGELSSALSAVLSDFSGEIDCTYMTTTEGDYLLIFLEREPTNPFRGHMLLVVLAGEGTMVAYMSRAEMNTYKCFAAGTIFDLSLQTVPEKTTYLEDAFAEMKKIPGCEVFPNEACEDGSGWLSSLAIAGEESFVAIAPMLDAFPETVIYSRALLSDGLCLCFVEPGTSEASAHALFVVYVFDEEEVGVYSQLYNDMTIDNCLMVAAGVLISDIPAEEVEE